MTNSKWYQDGSIIIWNQALLLFSCLIGSKEYFGKITGKKKRKKRKERAYFSTQSGRILNNK